MLLQATEKNFSELVSASDRPVLVHFWAPWCGPCRLVQPMLVQFQKEVGAQIKIVTFNADDSLSLANTYRIKSLPTLILFANGKEVRRFEGVVAREEIQKIPKLMKVSLVA
jgi:thioredoxin 1